MHLLSKRTFTLLIFFCMATLGCQQEVETIDAPNPPRHELRIDGKVQFHAELTWSASKNQLNTTIWAVNTGMNKARIQTGPCAFFVIAYHKNGDPVWYNRMPDDYVCFDEMLIYELAPKERKPLTGQTYISGDNWYREIPDGDWIWRIKAKIHKGETLIFQADQTKLD